MQHRVLVVDDYPDAQQLYASALREAGFEVDVASDGEQAIARVVRDAPDAIIMDLSMPVMDGWEAIRRIRATLGGATYVLALTAHYGDRARREAYEAGCDDFVNKPLAPDVLVGIVRQALEARARRT